MKQVFPILLVSIIFCSLFVFTKSMIQQKLMVKANFGVSHSASIKDMDLLLIGSSMFRQGIDIGTITGEEQNCYLLAYNGNQPYFEYKEMENFYEKGGKVKVLVIDMYAYSLTSMVKLSDVRILLDLNIKSQLEILKNMKEYGDADSETSYKMIVQANNELFLTWPISFPLINKQYKNGGKTSYKAGKTEEALSRLKPIQASTEINDKQLESLKLLINLCHEHNTKVIFVETPKYIRIYNINNDYLAIMKKYIKVLNNENVNICIHRNTAEKLSIIDNEQIIIYDFNNYHADNYSDLIHLSYNGRMAFSRILNEMLKSINIILK